MSPAVPSVKRLRAAGLFGALAMALLPVAVPGAPVAKPPAGPKAPATEAVDAAFFTREVQPILQQRCLGCHGEKTQLSKLDLRSRASALRGGVRGPALTPGKSANSLLVHFITGQRTPVMPPSGKLPAAEIAALRRWIDAGASWPDGEVGGAAEQTWWSFRLPVFPTVPQFTAAEDRAWVRTPIDAFVLDRLRKEGLSPSSPAPRRVLIRRAYLDLIGLPPAPEEVAAFEGDESPDAWEKVVDHLLASPHYGEKWGRHWLDLVRYADSSGFEGDKDRPLAWRYRDYVIAAFNNDKPYPQFIREQIAGDELRPGDPEALIATGYLACGPQDQVQKDAKTRADELDDLVATTGSVFLGLTVGCARCHDHKYDPVKQTDYYRLAALFSPTERREVEIPTPAERAEVERGNAVIDAEVAPQKARFEALQEKGQAAALARGIAKPNEAQIAEGLSEPERAELNTLREALSKADARRPRPPMALVVTDKSRDEPPFHLLLRGDADHPGQVVQPGYIVSLPGGDGDVTPAAATSQTTGRRRALAEWLARPTNPLPNRVWMNRVWQHHFGRGLVASVSNFGLNGELPTHPELLDYLALKFASLGGHLKPIQRMILLSSTYQQSSALRPREAAADPLDRWLWRMPVRRLEAEAVRDSILAAAGTLNRQLGGPPVYPPVDPSLRADTFLGFNWPEGEDGPNTWRRSVYIKVKRSLLFPQLEVFDCPEITASVAQRNVTTTPIQALALLNDPLVRRQAALFAERVQREVGDDPRKQVVRAYRLAVGRPPTPRETVLGAEFLAAHPLAEFCHALFNLNEFVYVP